MLQNFCYIDLFFIVGIFWDIENVRIPNCHQAIAVVEAIRQRFLMNYREAEFVVVCDVLKERKEVVIDLNNAQVFRRVIMLTEQFKMPASETQIISNVANGDE